MIRLLNREIQKKWLEKNDIDFSPDINIICGLFYMKRYLQLD